MDESSKGGSGGLGSMSEDPARLASSRSGAPSHALPVRIGLRYLRSLSSVNRASDDETIHVLDATERRQLRRIEALAVIGGALIGAMAGALGLAITRAGEYLALGVTQNDGILATWSVTGVTLAAIGIVTVIEIVLIYRITLRAVHRMAGAAGVATTSPQQESDRTIASLVAAAMEVPVSRDAFCGVDPLKRCPRWRIWIAAGLYKGKVFLSVLATRLVLRRLLSRVAVRDLVPFVGVPITAAWDAFVCRRALRDARLRMFARSAAEELLQATAELRGGAPGLSEAMIRAAACVCIEKRHLHDGLHRLLEQLFAEAPTVEAIDDPDRLRDSIERLGSDAQAAARSALLLAAVVDGRRQTRVSNLLASVLRLRPADARSLLRDACRSFVHGDGIAPGDRRLDLAA